MPEKAEKAEKKQKIQEYKHWVQIRDERIFFRPWKVLDQKNFIKGLQALQDLSDENPENPENHEKFQEVQNALVYNCLKNPKIALSPQEFRILITEIRKVSISDSIDFEYACEECDTVQKYVVPLDKIVKYTSEDYQPIQTPQGTLQMGKVPNVDFYREQMNACESTAEMNLVDFLLRIRKWGTEIGFTFEELQERFDDLNVKDAEEILQAWNEQKTNIDDTVQFKCKNCSEVKIFEFDEIPGFFTETWYPEV